MVRAAQPILPLRPGLPERQTHDYARHGTTTLFAALNVAAGKVIAQCQPRHRHQEFLGFLKQIDGATDPVLEVHLILDNYGTHKHPQVKRWIQAHPRYHLHLPDQRLLAEPRRTLFCGDHPQTHPPWNLSLGRDLVQAIQDYIRENHKNPQPFQWVASANTIIRKVRKYKWTLETGDYEPQWCELSCSLSDSIPSVSAAYEVAPSPKPL